MHSPPALPVHRLRGAPRMPAVISFRSWILQGGALTCPHGPAPVDNPAVGCGNESYMGNGIVHEALDLHPLLKSPDFIKCRSGCRHLRYSTAGKVPRFCIERPDPAGE